MHTVSREATDQYAHGESRCMSEEGRSGLGVAVHFLAAGMTHLDSHLHPLRDRVNPDVGCGCILYIHVYIRESPSEFLLDPPYIEIVVCNSLSSLCTMLSEVSTLPPDLTRTDFSTEILSRISTPSIKTGSLRITLPPKKRSLQIRSSKEM